MLLGDWDTRRNVIVNTSGEYDILFTNVNTYNNERAIPVLSWISPICSRKRLLNCTLPFRKIIGKPAKWADVFMVCLPTRILLRASYVVWDKAKVEAAGDDYTKELGITDLDELTAPLKAIKDTDGEASFPLNKNGGGLPLSRLR